jgi:hypothetical protein
MAKITFNSETYNAFLDKKKCCIATQASEYIDAMYSANSDADCLLDELRENIYYLKFLESAYVPIGDVLYPENESCQYSGGGVDYTGVGGRITDLIIINYYDLNGNSVSIPTFSFDSSAASGDEGSPSYIDTYLTGELVSQGFTNVQVVVTYSFPILSIQINANNLYFRSPYVTSDEGSSVNPTYSCEYVYASEDTNCITDDDAIKLSNLIHCDCCD